VLRNWLGRSLALPKNHLSEQTLSKRLIVRSRRIELFNSDTRKLGLVFRDSLKKI
jgi:hypothetical protein